jgi:hypothetical protein
MQKKKDITDTTILYLSILSSMLLFLSIMYGQKLASELWVMTLIIHLPIILFFTVIIIVSLIFWIRNYSKYDFPFLPLTVNILFIGLILILPLNKIRNRIEFATQKKQFEKAVSYVLSKQTEQTIYPETFRLPENYKNLSVGGGEAIVINKNTQKGVFFYTFRGVPDGRIGFLKIIGNDNVNDFTKELFNEVNEINEIGNNWYFISGE